MERLDERTDSSGPSGAGLARLLTGLFLFGAAFGFVEAAVVVDLRTIYEPLQRRFHPDAAQGELFPMLRLDELSQTSAAAARLLGIEVAREAGTLLMLAGVALCAGGSRLRGFAAFLVAFGVWDVSFYVFLKLLIGWPASIWTWDVLFLIPVPWTSPVIAPEIVAVTMAACGCHAIARDFRGDPIRPTGATWLAAAGGASLILVAFCKDFRHYLDGGLPGTFAWPVFWVGLGIGVFGYASVAFPLARIFARGVPAIERTACEVVEDSR
jgi:hypothetical protein